MSVTRKPTPSLAALQSQVDRLIATVMTQDAELKRLSTPTTTVTRKHPAPARISKRAAKVERWAEASARNDAIKAAFKAAGSPVHAFAPLAAATHRCSECARTATAVNPQGVAFHTASK